MQEDDPQDTARSELLERLKAMEAPQESGSLAELAYRRAREALEHALEEARTIRLEAIEDARNNRERELTALMESLRSLRAAAEEQINSLIREAEVHAERIRDQAQQEARELLEQANREAVQIRTDAAAIRTATEERQREIQAFEAEFDEQLEEIAKRLGMKRPRKGLFRHRNS